MQNERLEGHPLLRSFMQFFSNKLKMGRSLASDISFRKRYDFLKKISGEKENEQTITPRITKKIREAEVGRLQSRKGKQQKQRVVQAK